MVCSGSAMGLDTFLCGPLRLALEFRSWEMFLRALLTCTLAMPSDVR